MRLRYMAGQSANTAGGYLVKGIKRLLYNSFVTSIRVYQKLFLDYQVWGREYISPGPKIYVTNHITSTDPYWVLPVFPEPVHVIIGPGYQSKVMAHILDYFEQINAMPRFRKNVVDESVKWLQRGECVYTAPEGDIQELFTLGRFYPGVARIYRRARMPIIPIAVAAPKTAMKAYPRLDMHVDGRVYRAVFVLRGPFRVNIGKPFTPELNDSIDEAEDNQRIMDELKERMRLLLEDVRVERFWL